jgi:hypothetical protein
MWHQVKHDYHDHLQCACNVEESSKCINTQLIGGKTNVKFPLKLHELLDNAERDGIADIVSWQIHGRAFTIHNQKEFSLRVMPQYFNQSKRSSFIRQLSLYGFLRITQGRDKGAYYHERFLRGKSCLIKGILRQKIKGTKVKGLPSPETEPNFYSMPFVPQLHKFIPNLNGTETNTPQPPKISEYSFTHILNSDKNEIHSLNHRTIQNDHANLFEPEPNINEMNADGYHDVFSWETNSYCGMLFDSPIEEESLMNTLIHIPDHLSLHSLHFDDTVSHGTLNTQPECPSTLHSDDVEELSFENTHPTSVVYFSSNEYKVLLALLDDDD